MYGDGIASVERFLKRNPGSTQKRIAYATRLVQGHLQRILHHSSLKKKVTRIKGVDPDNMRRNVWKYSLREAGK